MSNTMALDLPIGIISFIFNPKFKNTSMKRYIQKITSIHYLKCLQTTVLCMQFSWRAYDTLN